MSYTSAREYLSRIDFVFHGLIAPPLFAFVYLYLELRDGDLSPYLSHGEGVALSDVVITFIWAGLMLTAFQMHRKKITRIRQMEPLAAKLGPYLTLLLTLSLLFFVISALCVAGLFLYDKNWYIILYFATLIHLSVYRPSPRKVAEALLLKGREYEIMVKRESFE
jgi:Zn-dependent protease